MIFEFTNYKSEIDFLNNLLIEFYIKMSLKTPYFY